MIISYSEKYKILPNFADKHSKKKKCEFFGDHYFKLGYNESSLSTVFNIRYIYISQINRLRTGTQWLFENSVNVRNQPMQTESYSICITFSQLECCRYKINFNVVFKLLISHIVGLIHVLIPYVETSLFHKLAIIILFA